MTSFFMKVLEKHLIINVKNLTQQKKLLSGCNLRLNNNGKSKNKLTKSLVVCFGRLQDFV